MINMWMITAAALGFTAIALFIMFLNQRRSKSELLTDYYEVIDQLALERDQNKQRAELKQRKKQEKSRGQNEQRRRQKEIEGLEAKIDELSRAKESYENESQRSLEKTRNELEHYKEQAEVLSKQLNESVLDKTLMKDQMQKLGQERSDKLKEQLEKSRKRLLAVEKELRGHKEKIARAEAKIRLQEETIKKHGPRQVSELERRQRQLQGFYNILKGKLEMSEGRCQNWEQALRHLSIWVLERSKTQKTAPITDNLGILVGQAMEITGGKPLGPDDDIEEESYQNENGSTAQAARPPEGRSDRLSIVRRPTDGASTAKV